ncbi:hypothetical protein GCM10027212_25710 [Actinotalea caeni]
MPPRKCADAAIHSRVARPDRRIAAARARRRPGSTAAPAPDTQDTTVIPWSYWDMEIVKPVAEPAAAATPPDDAPRPGLVSRLAAWCTTESAAQDRDPTVWMHRDVTA